ncbi:MAG: site-2 protease family protein [Desulfatibacillaceae bacterium]
MLGFLLVLVATGIVLVVHGLGQLAGARAVGLTPSRFLIGAGPGIFGRNIGHTEFSVRAVPFGAWIKEEDGEVPPMRRFAMLACGPLAMLLFSYLVFFAVLTVYGLPARLAVVEDVVAGSPAEAAGLLPGDRIRLVNYEKVESWKHIDEMTENSLGNPLLFIVDRGGRTVRANVEPRLLSSFAEGAATGDRYAVGLVFLRVMNRDLSPGEALLKAGESLGHVAELVGAALWWSVGGNPRQEVFEGASRFLGEKNALGGSLTAAWLYATAALGVILAILALVPLPMLNPLNGRRMFATLYRAVMHRRPSEAILVAAGGVALGMVVVLLSLAVVTTYI